MLGTNRLKSNGATYEQRLTNLRIENLTCNLNARFLRAREEGGEEIYKGDGGYETEIPSLKTLVTLKIHI
jgi:hypothetical protein